MNKVLNEEQIQAIEWEKGPLLIIAGAGTGKTTVVTERIKWLIESAGVRPDEILALTFTEKAAAEMEERVDEKVAYGATPQWIMTFHSFGDRILKTEGLHIGISTNYKLMTEAQAHLFLKKHFFEFEFKYFRPLGNPYKFISGLLQHFSRLKDEDVSPNEYLQWSQTSKKEKEEQEKYLELAKAYEYYEKIKNKEGVMDFSDLISKILQLFRTRPSILKQYQKQFKFILVDEFQDTNVAQNELVRMLAGDIGNITVVADDDQSIYKWRGAAVSNVLDFRKHFPEAKIIVLAKNYRSTQAILDSSYSLIQNNNPDRLEIKEKINKKLYGVREIKGEKIKLLHAERVEDEAEAVAKEINDKIQITNNKSNSNDKNQNKYNFSDFAILVRANSHAEPFVQALARHGIPYQFLGPGQLFRQPEIKDLIAYFKFLANIDDNVAFYRVLNMEHFGVSGREAAAVVAYAKRLNKSLFEASEELTKESPILEKLINLLHKQLELVPTSGPGLLLYRFLSDSELLKTLIEPKNITDEKRILNISKFFDKIRGFEGERKGDTMVFDLVEWLDLSMELGESPLATDTDWTGNNAVNILTVHSSKGLEFSVVFLVNLVSQRFPTMNRAEQIAIPDELVKETLPEGDFHLEEERRLFYVGMTRARDLLYFTAADYYADGKRQKKISPFVEEVGVNSKPQILNSKTNNLAAQMSLFQSETENKEKIIVKNDKVITPITYLSVSQIESYKNCPRQYQYKYIFRLPAPQNAAAALGSSIHLALRDFYEKVKQEQTYPSQEELMTGLENNWQKEGYKSKQEEQANKEKALRFLEKYYETNITNKSIVKPIALEQMFAFKTNGQLKIGGKIDRIDEVGNSQLEIIDYKTGKVPDEKKLAEDLQLTVYAMAVTDPASYNKKIGEVVLSFYFFEEQKKITVTRTREDLERAKKTIIDFASEISQSDFKPQPSELCKFCEYRLLCDAA